MTEPRQPYAGPADDGGDQGSFTVPSDSWVAPDAADPADRKAAGSLWSPGLDHDERKTDPHRGTGNRLRSALFTLLTLLVIGSVFVFFAYCNMPR